MDDSTHRKERLAEARLRTQLGDRIRFARQGLNLTQAEMGKRAGLDASAVSQFETGSRKPSIGNLIRLEAALRVSTDYLVLGVSEQGWGAELVRKELDVTGIEALALTIVRLLHGVSVSQTRTVLERAQQIIEWCSVFDNHSVEMQEERRAFDKHLNDSDE